MNTLKVVLKLMPQIWLAAFSTSGEIHPRKSTQSNKPGVSFKLTLV